MIPRTVAEIAAAIGCASPPTGAQITVTSVEFDTRRVRPGALFVALTGERVDGHDFVAAAAAAGAVAVLGSRDLPAGSLPILQMPDDTAVLQALSKIAGASVAVLIERGLTVIGVTGSAGKTSTKDLISAVLRAGFGPEQVVAPPESFNNELGHPYTVLRADDRTRFLVLELSARGQGHIAELAATAPPRIGAVLNVGSAHLGEFGSVAAIARAKGELVEALPTAAAGGIALLNADDPLVSAMSSRTSAAVVSVGTAAHAVVRAIDVRTDAAARARFTLVTPEGSAPVSLSIVGAHQLSNALMAAAVGRAVGMPVAEVATALSSSAGSSKWRMELTERADGVTVINDSYNANPESMKAALQALAVIGEHRRTWAVLGEMAELGELARASHDEIGRLVVRLGVDRLVVVGQAARALHLGAHLEGSWGGQSEIVADVTEAVTVLERELEPGDVVLVKASRSVGLDRVATALLERGDTRDCGPAPGRVERAPGEPPSESTGSEPINEQERS